jgi:hypothetical protein
MLTTQVYRTIPNYCSHLIKAYSLGFSKRKLRVLAHADDSCGDNRQDVSRKLRLSTALVGTRREP